MEAFKDKSSNPRSGAAGLGLLQDRPPRPGPLPEKSTPSPPILERFRALLKELTSPGGESPRPPISEEIVAIYEDALSELTFNSKPIITELTIIAGEQREFAEGIADAICSRILEAPVEQKLPSLYLLDSIVKNIGRDYVRYFAARLPEVFCDAYNLVDSNLHPAMRHLFGTWSQVFPPPALRKIESELEFSSTKSQQSSAVGNTRQSESASPRPAHGIHINPKYLEARRQSEQSTVMRESDQRNRAHAADFGGDLLARNAAEIPKGWSGASSSFHDIRSQRGVSSSLDVNDKKISTSYGDYDIDLPEVIPPHTGAARIGSLVGRSSAIVGSEKLLSHKKPELSRSSSPQVGLGVRHPEIQSAYSLTNEFGKNRPSKLIENYGSIRGKSILPDKPFKVQRLDTNGIKAEEATRKWQNSEEEEYIWEDMSPTLSGRRSNKVLPFDANFGSLSRRTSLSRPNASILESDFRSSNWQAHLPPTDDPTSIVNDRVPILGSIRSSMRPQISAERNELLQYNTSHPIQESWKSQYTPPQPSQLSLSPRSRGRIFQPPLPMNGLSTTGHRIPPYRSSCDAEVPFDRPPRIQPDSMNTGMLSMPLPSAIAVDNRLAHRPPSPHIVPTIWPPVHKSQPLPPYSAPSQQDQFRSPSDSVDANRQIISLGPSRPYSLPWQPSDAADIKLSNPYQNSTFLPLNQQSQGQPAALRFQTQDSRGNIISSSTSQIPSHFVAHSLNQVQVQGQSSIPSSVHPNTFSALSSSSLLMHGVSDASLHVRGGVLPPLPPGPPPTTSHIGTTQNAASLLSNSSGSPFSGLISSLMSQGLISLMPSTSSKDSIGVEFDPELLKIRHESAIDDLYVNLPRQCTTCGLRFKCQEEHSSHMDWHVTKNRVSKNRKQQPSRRWFVSAKEWLSGAEALGTDIVPGFLPTEAVVDKKEEKEVAVPADEDQNTCALCGESFEDFYSDEADEWMYKGAVYLNAPEGSIEGLSRSQLGPIVHAKCRSESSEVQRQS